MTEQSDLFSLTDADPVVLKRVMDFPWAEPVLILVGQNGELVRHFVQTHNAVYLTTLDVKIRPNTPYILENIDAFFKQHAHNTDDIFAPPVASPAETQFFAFLEHLKSVNSYLLLTAKTPPKQWPVVLDDLQSRFKTMPLI